MVFNATFTNISVISWRSVLLVEETRVPRENHRPVASHYFENYFTKLLCNILTHVELFSNSWREKKLVIIFIGNLLQFPLIFTTR
jgi:hypothetical protein